MSCGVRACGALFYKVSAGAVFLSESVKWCSKWCSERQDKCNMKFMFTGENCIAIVRTNMYNEEKDMHEKGALLLWQSQQIYM